MRPDPERQRGLPTVGDTVWVSRTVDLPAGRTVRPADWRPDDPVELLGPPRVVTRGGTADIAYPVVIWETGPRTLEVPGPLLLAANGGVDSLPPARVTLQVASVLPAAPDSALRPQPRADFVPLTDRSPLVPLHPGGAGHPAAAPAPLVVAPAGPAAPAAAGQAGGPRAAPARALGR